MFDEKDSELKIGEQNLYCCYYRYVTCKPSGEVIIKINSKLICKGEFVEIIL